MAKAHLLDVLGIAGDTPHPRLDSITRLAATVIDAPIALASMIQTDENRQVFASSHGLPDDLRLAGHTSLDTSICRYVQNTPLVIPDLFSDPRTADNPLVLQHGLRAYLGVPLRAETGEQIGVLCCLRTETCDWTPHQIEVMQQLAACVDDLIALGSARITAERAGQKLHQMATTRSGFVSHVSHEIRTPLTGMIGAIRLLSHLQLDGTAGTLVDLLNRSSQKLLDVVNDTLDLARLDSGSYRLVLQTCNLDQIAQDVMAAHRTAAAAKSVNVAVHNHLTGHVYLGDPVVIASVLDNIFGNAVKFTQNGSATITLSNDANGRVVITVADTGIGIAPALQAGIFDEFEHAGPTQARKQGGTGLGMAMIKRLVELMEGEITLISHPGKGTQITVALPLASPGADQP